MNRKIKTITTEWLESKEACEEGIAWFTACGKKKPLEVMEALLTEGLTGWANWLIVRLLSPKDRIRYAIFAADQVIELFEKARPNDKRPREAIGAAKAVLEKDTDAARAVAKAAAKAADDAALEVASAAMIAARIAAMTAEAATRAALEVSDATLAVARAAWAAGAIRTSYWDVFCAASDHATSMAAIRTAWSATGADMAMEEKIIRYGMDLYFKGGSDGN